MSDFKEQIVIELLCVSFPNCFALRETQRRPLKIGIFEDILTVLPGVISKTKLKAALKVYAASYRSRLVIGMPRIDLNGEVAGEVLPEHLPEFFTAARKCKPEPKPEPKPGPTRRLSLTDLKAAALARKGTAQ
jgi:sRNA-binding protein